MSAAFSLSVVACWGIADFTGGYASKRADALMVTIFAHTGALLFLTPIAFLRHSSYPALHSLLWAFAAGVCGASALVIFYTGLARGKMGITASVSALVGAAIPAAFGILHEGLPGSLRIGGFLLAGVAIWLISRAEDDSGTSGLTLAILAGTGFAGFFLCMKQAGNGSALWIAVASRVSSLVLTLAILLLTS
ncbi:MAG: transporter, partial [Acidobacteriales bacterium]|nr:transporter [Terriglobales bacterium]